MTEKEYRFTVRNDKGKTISSGSLSEQELESIGGIGNFVESINYTLKNNESIEIQLYYHSIK